MVDGENGGGVIADGGVGGGKNEGRSDSYCPTCKGFLQGGAHFEGRLCGTCHGVTVGTMPVEPARDRPMYATTSDIARALGLTAAEQRAAVPPAQWSRCAHCRLMTTDKAKREDGDEEPCVPGKSHDWRRLVEMQYPRINPLLTETELRISEQIESLQHAVAAIERRQFPLVQRGGPRASEAIDLDRLVLRVEALESGKSGTLADEIRKGWSGGYRLIGLTTPRHPADVVEPVWGPATHAANELRKAALDFDASQERLVELLSDWDPSPELANETDQRVTDLVRTLKDLIVSLGDCAAAYQLAARGVE